MDQRRFLVFFKVSMVMWIGWMHFLVPILFPPPPPAAPKLPASVVSEDEEPADALNPSKGSPRLTRHPSRSIWIGPQKDEEDTAKLDEFFLAANFSTEGASIDSIELTDVKRYPAFGHRGQRLKILGSDPFTDRRTMELQVPAIDQVLNGQSVDHANWEVVDQSADSVTFRLTSPDNIWELTKKFRLRRLTAEEQKLPGVRDNFAEGYKVFMTVTLRNLSDDAKPVSYVLHGPTGIPLEDAQNAYKYRDVRMGFLRDDGKTVDDSKLSATDVVKKEKAKTQLIWERPIKYIGVDVAYFATLLLPGENQVKQRTVAKSQGVTVSENKTVAYSDISVDLTSKDLTVPAHGSIEHEYTLYAGPKRQQLLSQVSAAALMDYGWFDTICRGMLWILNTFHAMGLSYGLAIICLTIAVRTCLIPLSKHQAAHSARMKELQPKIQARQKELEARHGKNTEEYLKASQELVAEQSKMMLGGCLPMMLQLPIFIALYRSLSSSIDLRMEPFLWFQNLASPDALFRLPFTVPFLGWTEFNLLPCISIGFMMLHQKLTMPPPQNEEQAAQYKMMNIMMFVMGATFYRVPAGLCLYFISTNIWSMTERWIFEKKAKAAALNPPPVLVGVPGNPVPPKKPSAWLAMWQKWQEAADKDTALRRTDKSGNRISDDNNKNKKKKGKR